MKSINTGRRQALKDQRQSRRGGGQISADVPASAFADWNKAAFNDVLKAMGGASAEKSGDIAITAPDIAENGAVVPIAVASKIPGTQSIAILVEKNPPALSAQFDIPAGTEANVGTRVKMGQSKCTP